MKYFNSLLQFSNEAILSAYTTTCLCNKCLNIEPQSRKTKKDVKYQTLPKEIFPSNDILSQFALTHSFSHTQSFLL